MTWPNFWSSSSSSSSVAAAESSKSASAAVSDAFADLKSSIEETTSSPSPAGPSSFLSSLSAPSTLVSTVILTTSILSLLSFQRRFARRIPTASAVPPRLILPSTRSFLRSIFGQVTSIGDADNFRLYHTPLGRLALWGILRPVPSDPKKLKNNTIHVRLAGIDAPELAHFGRPAQPYGKEALEWLSGYLKGRRVRCYVHKSDQYGRVVGTVYIWKWGLRRDVGLQMLKTGLATVYESKSGAEFGGPELEKRYRDAEMWAKRKRRGMWKAADLETPREYKNRYRGSGGPAQDA